MASLDKRKVSTKQTNSGRGPAVPAVPARSAEVIRVEKRIGFHNVDPRIVVEPDRKVRVTRSVDVARFVISYNTDGVVDGTTISVMLPEGFKPAAKGELPREYIVVDGCHRIQALQQLSDQERFQSVPMTLYQWLTPDELLILGFCTFR